MTRESALPGIYLAPIKPAIAIDSARLPTNSTPRSGYCTSVLRGRGKRGFSTLGVRDQGGPCAVWGHQIA